MKRIATAVSTIEDVLNEECVYVDKTAYLYKLIMSVDRLFFISRPRRFGKSLMLSTLKAIFEGRKEMFEGLAISKTEYDWKPYDVLYLDMSSVRENTVEEIRDSLNDMVMDLAEQVGVTVKKTSAPGTTFENFWREIAKQNRQVVVLVDEYDVPLQGFLNDPKAIEAIRLTMHDFYVRLKTHASNIRFMMMTGVTKLTKLSVFSGLNNPVDLSMNADYAGMFGYTEAELRKNFKAHIKSFANSEKVKQSVIVDRMLEWYDHYRFSPKSDVKVLNPVSVGKAFCERTFKGYWNSTGGATLVIEALNKADKLPAELDDIDTTEDLLDVCDAISLPVVPLLYQSGYLTIKSVDGELIKLGIPNEEVRSAIVNGHINSIFGMTKGPEFIVDSVKAFRALKTGDLQCALTIFRSAIAGLSYEWLIKDEGAVKVAFLDFFNGMRGVTLGHERHTANGRIDAVIDLPHATYIFEFKYNHTSQEAFDQILEKKYHEPYVGKGKPIYGIGLNFNPDSGSRGIDEPVVREIG